MQADPSAWPPFIQQQQSRKQAGGDLDYGTLGAPVWWDLEACARQLPYHRILVAAAETGDNSYSSVAHPLREQWCGTRLPT